MCHDHELYRVYGKKKTTRVRFSVNMWLGREFRLSIVHERGAQSLKLFRGAEILPPLPPPEYTRMT